MTVRIIHTADWQIGKPFRNFPPALAAELAAARLDAIAAIAKIARDVRATHVLVAGDVFDSERLDSVLLRRTLERLAQESPLTWVLLPGNHDAARAGGLWERIVTLGLPANVVALVEPEPHRIASDAVVLPAPLTSKNPGYDPAAWMASCPTAPGTLRIGLAHGSVQGFGSEGESAVMIARDHARRAGLDYLALGDWHGVRQIDERTWYSGTPEPDSFPANEPGFVLSAILEPNAPPAVARHASARFAWRRMEAAVRDLAGLEGLEAQVARDHPRLDRVLLKLDLKGSLPLAGAASLAGWQERMMGKLRHLELASKDLALLAGAGDYASLGGSGPLVETARRLDEIAADPAHAQSAAARVALARLFALVREAGAAGS